MRGLKVLIRMAVLAVIAATPVFAGLVLYEFQTGMPADLHQQIDSGFTGSIDVIGGYLHLAGSGTGFVRVATDPVSGDFLAAAIVERTSLSSTGTTGLALYFDWPPSAGSPFASIYLDGQGTISSVIYAESGSSADTAVSLFPMSVLFYVLRVGDSITTYYDNGTMVQVLTHSHPAFGGDVSVGLFLGESGSASLGRFDVLAIQTPDLLVPEPATIGLLAAGLLCLAAGVQRRRRNLRGQ